MSDESPQMGRRAVRTEGDEHLHRCGRRGGVPHGFRFGRATVRPAAGGVRTVIRTAKPTFPGRPPSAPPAPSTPAPPPHPGAGDDDASTELVGELQRLAAMHRAGELTDEEFATARQHVLRAP